MLSAETAAGQYPSKVIEAMDRICAGAERQRSTSAAERRINIRFKDADEAIAKAAMYTANSLGVKAIAALTESGATALWMSRISSGIPIFAMTRHVETRRKVTLYRGVDASRSCTRRRPGDYYQGRPDGRAWRNQCHEDNSCR